MYKKFMLVLFVCLIAAPAFSQMILNQSTAVNVVVGPAVTAEDPSTAIISNASWTVYGYKNGTEVAFASHTITHKHNGYFTLALTTTDTNTLGRLKVTCVVPSALTFWHNYIVVPANVYSNYFTSLYINQVIADQVWDEALSEHATANTAGDYVIDTRGYVDTEVAAILVDTGTTIPGTIVDVSAAIAAGVSPTDIIPASGITRPSPNYGKIIGDFEPNLWFEGLSSTDATPTISIELLAASGSGLVLWATEAAFTYSKYTTHTGEYKHRYKYQITNSLPDDWYIGHFNCQSEGSWYSVPFNFIKDASIVIDAGSLLTAATFNSFVSDASQSFNDIKSGHPNRFQIYTSDHHLVRAQAGVSSAKSRYVTAGLIYGSSVSYIDRFSDLIRSATWLYDYDEATNTRGGVYELLNSDLTAESVIDNVSISVPGD